LDRIPSFQKKTKPTLSIIRYFYQTQPISKV